MLVINAINAYYLKRLSFSVVSHTSKLINTGISGIHYRKSSFPKGLLTPYSCREGEKEGLSPGSGPGPLTLHAIHTDLQSESKTKAICCTARGHHPINETHGQVRGLGALRRYVGTSPQGIPRVIISKPILFALRSLTSGAPNLGSR